MSKNDELVLHIITESAIKAMSVQCKVEARAGLRFHRPQGTSPTCAIAGIVGFKNENVTGVISICFSKDVFLAVMNRMLNEHYTEITDDVASGAAEILNIIYFNARSELKSRGILLSEAVPTAVRGQGLKTTHADHSAITILPFTADIGEFQIEVSANGQWSSHV